MNEKNVEKEEETIEEQKEEIIEEMEADITEDQKEEITEEDIKETQVTKANINRTSDILEIGESCLQNMKRMLSEKEKNILQLIRLSDKPSDRS